MSIRIWFGLILSLFVGSANAVVGGEQEADKDWPSVVSLRYFTGLGSLETHQCGGAYIGRGLIVSAAHCVALAPATRAYACMGGSGTAAKNNCYPLAKSVIHPQYVAGSYDKDIAVYQMASYPENYPAVRLISEAENLQLQAGENLKILGLGSTAYESYQPAYQLQGAISPIADIDTCNNQIAADVPHAIADEDFICSGKRTKGPAPGDSGTPAFVFVDGEEVYAGLVSHGYNYMGLFTRIGRYLDWIKAMQLELLGPLDFAKEEIWHIQDPYQSQPLSINLKNTSDSTIELSDFDVGSEHFSIVDTNECSVLEVSASCQLKLDVLLNEASHAVAELTFNLADEALTIDLLVLPQMPSELLAVYDTPFDVWNVSGLQQWSSLLDEGIAFESGNEQVRQYLVGDIEGPGQLALDVFLGSYSGSGSLSISVDEHSKYQLSGDCKAELAVDIPEGVHSVKIAYQADAATTTQANTNSSVGAKMSPSERHLYTQIMRLEFEEGANESSSIDCDFTSKLADELVNISQPAAESGGGSIGFAGLALLSLAWLRRKQVA